MTGNLRSRSEDGAVLLTVIFSMVTILAIAALVLDLAALRLNRSVSQTIADSAATAGALDLNGASGRDGCETALAYLEINLPGSPSLSGGDCLSFPTTCDSGTPSVSTTASADNWVVTITYPVPNGSTLMQPSTIGDPGQAVHGDDGTQCDRLGVSLQNTYNHSFGQIIGAGAQTTQIHAVAKSNTDTDPDVAINLLVLERYECNALSANGGGSIIVDAVYNTNTGQLDAGYVAVDSDASGGCGGNGVIDTSGAGSSIRADGPDGCAWQLGTHADPVSGLLVGEGCGTIEVLAPGTPGCNYPACSGTGTILPDPQQQRERLTRAPVDHFYNCKSTYSMPLGWDIKGCPDTPDPHIDDLVAAYAGPGMPAGFTSWTGAGYKCNPNGDVIVPAGNWYVDCSNFAPKNSVVFTGGDVVFLDRITLNGGNLIINGTGLTAPFSAATDAAVAYLRTGKLSKGGSAGIVFLNTMVYLSSTADISMTGGSGPLIWESPISGDFDGLAMWAETGSAPSPGEIKLAGSSGLSLEGVFFAPWSNISYSGNGSQEQVAAQFIARSLEASGGGTLVVRPNFTRAIKVPANPESQLIR